MKKIPANDAFQRMNYLYQISKEMADKNVRLSAYYGSLIGQVAKKSVIKVNPDIKRQFCKRCASPLIQNTSSNTKIVKKNKCKYIEVLCFICKCKRRIPAKENCKIWVEKPESIVEVVS